MDRLDLLITYDFSCDNCHSTWSAVIRELILSDLECSTCVSQGLMHTEEFVTGKIHSVYLEKCNES